MANALNSAAIFPIAANAKLTHSLQPSAKIFYQLFQHRAFYKSKK